VKMVSVTYTNQCSLIVCFQEILQYTCNLFRGNFGYGFSLSFNLMKLVNGVDAVFEE